MKTIYLLRHAKSDWDDAALADHDRRLNERGREAAPRLSAPRLSAARDADCANDDDAHSSAAAAAARTDVNRMAGA